MDGVKLSQGYGTTTVYFLPVSFQEFLVVIESTLVGWNAVLTLEPPNGLELGTLRLGMHWFNH